MSEAAITLEGAPSTADPWLEAPHEDDQCSSRWGYDGQSLKVIDTRACSFTHIGVALLSRLVTSATAVEGSDRWNRRRWARSLRKGICPSASPQARSPSVNSTHAVIRAGRAQPPTCFGWQDSCPALVIVDDCAGGISSSLRRHTAARASRAGPIRLRCAEDTDAVQHQHWLGTRDR
jgi:hypothetical protein